MSVTKQVVVYAEDNKELRIACTRALSDDFDTKPCVNGKEAFDTIVQLKNEGITPVLLTDLEMPVMDGIGLLNGLFAAGISIPTILMSGDPHQEEKLKAAQIQPDKVIPKGSRLAVIEETIAAALKKHEIEYSTPQNTVRPTGGNSAFIG